jgi:Flp pilus assembly protein TadD
VNVTDFGWRQRAGRFGLVLLIVVAATACGGGGDDQAARSGVDVGMALVNGLEAQSTGRRAEAEEQFDIVLQGDPGNRVALFNLGILRRARGDLSGSIAAFTELVEADSGFTTARQQRAISRQSAGDVDGAIADLRIVVDEDPDNPEARLQLGALLVATGEVVEGEALLAR